MRSIWTVIKGKKKSEPSCIANKNHVIDDSFRSIWTLISFDMNIHFVRNETIKRESKNNSPMLFIVHDSTLIRNITEVSDLEWVGFQPALSNPRLQQVYAKKGITDCCPSHQRSTSKCYPIVLWATRPASASSAKLFVPTLYVDTVCSLEMPTQERVAHRTEWKISE